MEAKEIWKELNNLKETTYKQATQIEVLKEKNIEEKLSKDRSMAWNLRGFGILATALMAVVAYSFTLNATIATLKTTVEGQKVALETQRVAANKNLDWVEDTFVSKEVYIQHEQKHR